MPTPTIASPCSTSRRLSTVIVLLLAIYWPSSLFAVNYTATGSGNVNTAIWFPGGGTPGVGDTATIPNGFTVDFATLWQVDALTVQAGGTVIGTAPMNTLQADAVTVDLGGELRGIDALGGGGTLSVTALTPNFLTVQNDGLMRGGHPYGNLRITDSQSRSTCSTTSSILSNGGSFLGGNAGGDVFMVSGVIDLYNANVEGGSGAVPFGMGGVSQGGNVYISGHTIVLDGSFAGFTQVLSGSNTTPGGTGGTVALIAPSCGFPSLLYLGNTTNVNVGGPSIGGCPEVTLFSAGVSTLLGTVGNMGTTCGYWDPPQLQISGNGRMHAEKLTVVGETFSAAGLTGTGLQAGQTLSLMLAPGGVLDLQGLTPGQPYFQAGDSITLCADEILVDPGVSLDELMEPPPFLCPGQSVLTLDLTPALEQGVQAGDSFTLTLQVTHIGNAPGDVEATLHDTAGWLVGGPQAQAQSLAPGDTLTFLATITVPAAPAHDVTKLTLRASIAGQPAQEQRSFLTLQ